MTISNLFPLKRDVSVVELEFMMYKYSSFTAPEQFQRPEAWSAKERAKFFVSILMNRVEGSFVLVDIKSALNKIIQSNPEDRARNYFQSILDQLYKYIVLDGNNRLKFIQSLLNDEYGIPEGSYEYIRDVNDNSVSRFTVKRGKNNKFSDLPEEVQKVIKERKCILSEYTQICYEGLSEVFLNVNSGVPLNAQEKRNAMNTPWADYVREVRYNVATLLSQMFNDYNKRLVADDWIVECLDFVYQAIEKNQLTDDVTFNSITQTSKDRLYGSPFLNEDDQIFYIDTFNELSDFIVRMIDEKVLDEKTLKRKSAVQNLFWMMCNGIETYDQAKEAVLLHEKAFQDKSRVFEEDVTFKNACEGARKLNVEIRYIILNEIVEKVKSTVAV